MRIGSNELLLGHVQFVLGGLNNFWNVFSVEKLEQWRYNVVQLRLWSTRPFYREL